MATHPSDVDAEALAQCASEPIHVPGSIQPHGVLLGLDTTLDEILFASANAATFFGGSITTILASPAPVTLGAALVERIRTLLRETGDGAVLPVDLAGLPALPQECTLFAHRFHDRVIVELVDESPHERLNVTLASTVSAVSRAVQLAQATTAAPDPAAPTPAPGVRNEASVGDAEFTMQTLCESAAQAVRRFTGYDRVMLYQFDADGSGTVIAEAHHDDLSPFLGLHYPAADIPAQARALYLRTRVRVLGDRDGTPVPLVTATAATAARPLDLSYSVLRSMSPVHLQYLRNMHVAATLAVSIIIDGALWGMIVCHHREPKWPSHAMREASDVLSEFVSVQLTVQENQRRASARARAASAQQSVVQQLMRSGGNLEQVAGQLQEIIPSDGLAVVTEKGVYCRGSTPSTEDVRALVSWLEARGIERVVAFESLGSLDPAFSGFASVASGVLALNLGGDRPRFVLWFRPEASSTVRWAGMPAKGEVDDGGIARLTPRASFEEWREQRRGRAHPWSREELLIAEDIRGALVEIVMGLLPTLERMTRLQFARIRAAVDAASDAITMTDHAGLTTYGNRAFLNLTGAMPDALPAPETVFGVAPVTAAELEQVPGMTSGAAAERIEVDAQLADGRAIPVSLLVDPIIDDEGTLLGTLFIATDIRARRSLEEERLRLEQNMMQRQKLESIGLLAGGIAHDFNNLLATIVMNATLAKDAVPADSDAQRSIGEIETAAQHGAALCRELLAYAGRGRFVVRPISVSDLLDEMGRLLRVVTNPAATVTYRLSPQLPLIDADEAQLRQVFMNLLVNATEALDATGGRIVVTTGVRSVSRHDLDTFHGGDQLAPGDYVEVTIADTGHGMSTETLGLIFDPFYTTKVTGRGLGLAAVLGIISGHHGAIRVESSEGVGTTFSLIFPPGAIPAAPRQVDVKPALQTLGRGRMALVVDDEPGVRESTRRILERAGFVVHVANDGKAGLAMFRDMSDRLALVVSDVSMPELNGTALLKQIREDGHSIPVMLVSGYTDNESQSFIVNDAHATFMQKPFGVSALLTAIGQLLNT